MWDDSIIKERFMDKFGKLRQRITYFQFIALSVAFGVLAWVLDAIVDLLVSNESGKSFFDILIGDLTAFGLYVRLVISGSFFVFGMIVSVFLAKHKRAEEALRDSEVKLRAILESIPDAVTVANMDRIITDFNQAAMDLHGFSTREKLIGMNILDLIAPQDRERAIATVQKAATGGSARDMEFSCLTQDGHEFPAEMSVSVIRDQNGNPTSLVGTAKNITQRKQTDDALRKSEEKFRTLFDNLSDPVFIHDLGGRFLEISRIACKFLGYSREELSQMTHMDIFPPEEAQLMSERIESLRQHGHILFESRMMRRDGSTTPIEVSSRIIEYDGVPAMLCSIRDITQRKLAEKALQESEERYRILFEDAPDAIFIADTESGRILDANPAASRLLLKSHEEIVKLYQPEVHPPQIRESAQEQFSASAWQEGQLHRIESVVLRSDGGEVPVEISAHIINLQSKPVMQAIFRDVTERKRMEEELFKTQKFESISVFAGGIAHDLNNLLTGVMGNISLARRHENPADRDEKLAEAERESMRIRDLTHQLLTFAKGGTPILNTTAVGGLLRESTTFALRGSNVKCEFAIPDDLWAVEIDEGQINQVVNNLMINAKQAMPEGGAISVRCENITLDAGRSLPLDAGAYIKISVEDQGIGITPEHLQKIFDPFFTTKQEGSGLGLATSYSIIHKHNGHISVESQIGVGTAFHIYLPASPKQAAIVKEKVEKQLTMGVGRVLVMDDEEHLRDLANGVLGSIGYKVTTAIDGAETIELYQEAMGSGHPFDAVIMDLTIPGGMGGKEAIKKLAEIDPGVKAIVSRG